MIPYGKCFDRRRFSLLTGLLITILVCVVMFKITRLLFRLCAKMLALTFSIAGYVLIGVLCVGLIGFLALPIVLIAGLVSLFTAK